MKHIILSILLVTINSVFAVSFNYAIGNSTPSQTFQYTTSNNKFARLDIEITASTNISFFQHQMMGSLVTDTQSYIEVSCTGLLWRQLKSDHLSTYWGNDYTRAKGTINITVSGTTGSDSGGSSGLSQWGVTGTITITEKSQCPNTDLCASSTCEYCKNTYCSVHDVHCTGIYTHGENANQPETTHVHCTNNADLLSQWRSQIEGTCPDCGKFICKLCPHSCLDMPCPNGRYCVKETCSTCGGVYCSRHMMHICANFTEMSQNTGNDNFSVQTTITGQAVVHVNIQDNSTGGGSNVDLSSTNSLLGQIESNTMPLSGKLDDLKAAINTQTSQLNNKLDGVNNSIQNQTTELSGKMNDVKNSVNDVKESVDDVKESIENQTTDLSNKLDSLETAVSDMSNQNHGDLDTWGSAIDGKLGDIGEKLDNLKLDGDLNVDLGGLGGKIDSTNAKLDTIMDGNGNLGLGSVGNAAPASGVGSEIVENELTGKEIDNVQKVEYFTAIKNKLLPPRFEIGSYDACFSFDIPTVFGEPLHLTLDFNDEKLRAVRLAVRSFSSVLMILVFMFGILRMIRQY